VEDRLKVQPLIASAAGVRIDRELKFELLFNI
jgi:hypothetical protein